MTQINFLYTQKELYEIANQVLQTATIAGASSAQVELSECISTDIEVLNQHTENFETSHENQLLLTVFKGHKKGNIGISNIQPANIEQIVRQALDIATYTEEDPENGLLEEKYLVTELHADLQLYHTHQAPNQELIAEVKDLEQRALNISSKISASDGASLSLTRYNFVTANTNGLNHGYQTSRYSKYVSLIGENAHGMQTDYWYSSSRDFNDLIENSALAQTAAMRVLRRLERGEFKTSQPKVIFESSIAKSIIGSLVGALSGNSLFRRLSFLNDSLGSQILPSWFNLNEDPFILKGLSSCYFDNEGSKVVKRKIIDSGKVNGYLLSSYSARKLNMLPTGNAGGSHNLLVEANFKGDLAALALEMQDGIIIIETIGHGLNMVTGDYSVGASGLVVQNGKISHFVDNLTISGNMREIYQNILAVANDSEASSIICGSMLINSGIIQVNSKND